MQKLITKTVLAVLAALPTFAMANEILRLESSRGDKVALFDDSTERKPRCLCATFSVIVKPSEALGAPAVSEIKIIRRSPEGEVLSESTNEVRNTLYRCLGSAWHTEQTVVLEPDNSNIEVQALAQKCMNPTHEACKEKVVVASGKFTTDDIISLKAITPAEAAEMLTEDVRENTRGCR